MAVIIWGWGNYNKRNTTVNRAVCESCGYQGHLTSYDTSRFFTLYYLPLIPLGRKHIIDECPKCRGGRMVSSRKWNNAEATEVKDALEAFRASPTDAELAEQALGLASQFCDKPRFQTIAQEVAEHHIEDAQMLAKVGATCSYRMLDDDAQAALEASLALNDDPDVRELLVVHALHRGDVETAEPHLKRVLADRGADAAGLMVLHAEACQGLGKHDEALAILDEHAKRFPEHADEHSKYLAKRRKLSQRNLDRGRLVPSEQLAVGREEPRDPSLLRRLAPLMIFPLMLLAIVTGIVAMGYYARPNVYLVSGLDAPYDVVINEQRYTLAPRSHRMVVLSYGVVTVSPVEGDAEITAETAELNAPFWSRVFGTPTFVINPDRIAPLIWETAQYGENIHTLGDGRYELHINRLVHTFKSLDYEFEQLPDTIQLPEGSRPWKETIYTLPDYTPSDVYRLVDSELGPEAAKDHLLLRLAVLPDDLLAIYLMRSALDADAAVELLRPRLDDRPVRVEWHRLYQDSVETADPDFDLVAEYTVLYEADPEDGALAYLLARVTPDPDAAAELCRAGAEAPRPNAYAHYGLAYHAMMLGEFSDALAHTRRALETEPDNVVFLHFETSMRMAQRQFAELARESAAALAEAPDDYNAATNFVTLSTLAGDTDAAREAINDYLDALQDTGEELDAETLQFFRGVLEMSIAEAQDDVAAYLSAIEATGSGESWGFQTAAVRGDWGGAATLIEQEEYFPGELDHLLLYAGAAFDGDTELAQAQLDDALTILRESTPEHRAMARWLSGEEPLPENATRRLPYAGVERSVVLTAFAARFPEHRARLLEQARAHDYEPEFPHLALMRLLDTPAPADSEP